MAHLYGYARVSTGLQDPALQKDALKAAGCARIFTDKASGKLDRRPQLDKLLDVVLPGDVVVVWRLDRLGRSKRHLIETVGELGERGVGFRSLKESIDTTTAGGKLLFHIMGALAEFDQPAGVRPRGHGVLTKTGAPMTKKKRKKHKQRRNAALAGNAGGGSRIDYAMFVAQLVSILLAIMQLVASGALTVRMVLISARTSAEKDARDSSKAA